MGRLPAETNPAAAVSNIGSPCGRRCVFLFGWLLALGLPTSLKAQATIDLQQGHDLGTVLASGISVQELPGSGKIKRFRISSQRLRVVLFGGRQVESWVDSGNLAATASGKLVVLSLRGPILPTQEVHALAQRVQRSFGMSSDRLEQWRTAVEGKGRDAPTFTAGPGSFYPRVFLEISSSLNTLYPWRLKLEFSWNVDPEDKRDESWAEQNNSLPPAGFERLSLESPTGKLYQRADAHAAAALEQAELDDRLGQVSDEKGLLQPPSKKPQTLAVLGGGGVQEPKNVVSPRWWMLAVAAVIVVISLCYVLLKRRKWS